MFSASVDYSTEGATFQVSTKNSISSVKMKRMLILIALLALFIPETSVIAGDASPYVVGQWKLKDLFADCDSNTVPPK